MSVSNNEILRLRGQMTAEFGNPLPELLDELLAYRAVARWRKASEELPENMQGVQFILDGEDLFDRSRCKTVGHPTTGQFIKQVEDEGDGFYSDGPIYKVSEVAYWRPLPTDLPKGDGR